MRRIYESDAIERDGTPFTPSDREPRSAVQSFQSIDSSALSRRVVPHRLRYRAISVDVSTPRTAFSLDEPIPFTVMMRNRLPIPIVLRTRSPLLWTWRVDGQTDASRVARHDPPDEPGQLRFDRGERKRFRKEWRQLFRVSDAEWEPADSGEHTIAARVNVPDATARGLAAETTVRIRADS